jgi:transposase-like protein
MNEKQKNYNKAFKENAVKSSYERNSIRDLSQDLGINENILYRWRGEYSEFKQASFGGKGVLRLIDEKSYIPIPNNTYRTHAPLQRLCGVCCDICNFCFRFQK